MDEDDENDHEDHEEEDVDDNGDKTEDEDDNFNETSKKSMICKQGVVPKFRFQVPQKLFHSSQTYA